jgi:hypothetical protein
MDTPTLIVWGAVEMAGVILAIICFGPSSYRHRARHRARWWTRLDRLAPVKVLTALNERHPRDEWGRWLIPVEGEPSDQG